MEDNISKLNDEVIKMTSKYEETYLKRPGIKRVLIQFLNDNGIEEDDKLKIKSFLSECSVISLNDEVKDLSIKIKQKFKVKTPDDIIASTAIHLNLPLITADKGFDKITNLDLMVYQL